MVFNLVHVHQYSLAQGGVFLELSGFNIKVYGMLQCFLSYLKRETTFVISYLLPWMMKHFQFGIYS